MSNSQPRPSAFFANFSTFKQDPTASLLDEFNRLSISQGWDASKAAKKRRRCVVAEFETHFASFGTKLEGWQSLCAELDIAPAPVSITKCKKALAQVNVNIWDLIDVRREGKGQKVHKFKSGADLRDYTTSSGRIFPKKAAKKDGFLKILLKEIY